MNSTQRSYAVFFHVNQATTSAQASEPRVAASMPRPCTTASRNINPAVVTVITPANSYAASATSAVMNTRPDIFTQPALRLHISQPFVERSVPEVSSTGEAPSRVRAHRPQRSPLDHARNRPAARRPSRRRRRRRPARRGTEEECVRRATDPSSASRTDRLRFHPGDLHRIDAAHLPGADRERPIRGGEDHRVRFDVRADAPRKSQRLPLVGGRLPLRHDTQLALTATAATASTTRSRDCTSTAPRIDRSSRPRVVASAREVGGHDAHVGFRRQDRRAPRRPRPARSTASMNVETIACAVCGVDRRGSSRRCRQTPRARRPRARGRRRRRRCCRWRRRTDWCA